VVVQDVNVDVANLETAVLSALQAFIRQHLEAMRASAMGDDLLLVEKVGDVHANLPVACQSVKTYGGTFLLAWPTLSAMQAMLINARVFSLPVTTPAGPRDFEIRVTHIRAKPSSLKIAGVGGLSYPSQQEMRDDVLSAQESIGNLFGPTAWVIPNPERRRRCVGKGNNIVVLESTIRVVGISWGTAPELVYDLLKSAFDDQSITIEKMFVSERLHEGPILHVEFISEHDVERGTLCVHDTPLPIHGKRLHITQLTTSRIYGRIAESKTLYQKMFAVATISRTLKPGLVDLQAALTWFGDAVFGKVYVTVTMWQLAHPTFENGITEPTWGSAIQGAESQSIEMRAQKPAPDEASCFGRDASVAAISKGCTDRPTHGFVFGSLAAIHLKMSSFCHFVCTFGVYANIVSTMAMTLNTLLAPLELPVRHFLSMC
jgi:hypothetical protein